MRRRLTSQHGNASQPILVSRYPVAIQVLRFLRDPDKECDAAGASCMLLLRQVVFSLIRPGSRVQWPIGSRYRLYQRSGLPRARTRARLRRGFIDATRDSRQENRATPTQ